MKIVNQFPPRYEEIKKAFNLDPKSPIVFTVGETIYNPMGCVIDEPLMKHEETHFLQQTDTGIDYWWDRYLTDPKFRFYQELSAYQKQYQLAKRVIKDRESLHRFLWNISRDLSGPMYGNIINFQEAMSKIKQ